MHRVKSSSQQWSVGVFIKCKGYHCNQRSIKNSKTVWNMKGKPSDACSLTQSLRVTFFAYSSIGPQLIWQDTAKGNKKFWTINGLSVDHIDLKCKNYKSSTTCNFPKCLFYRCGYSLVFHRKDLCEAKHEMQSVFKFSDVLFALKSDVPPSRGI